MESGCLGFDLRISRCVGHTLAGGPRLPASPLARSVRETGLTECGKTNFSRCAADSRPRHGRLSRDYNILSRPYRTPSSASFQRIGAIGSTARSATMAFSFAAANVPCMHQQSSMHAALPPSNAISSTPLILARQTSRRSRLRLVAQAVAATKIATDKKAPAKSVEMSPETAADLYRDMMLGRDFEDMCAQMYYRGKMFGELLALAPDSPHLVTPPPPRLVHLLIWQWSPRTWLVPLPHLRPARMLYHVPTLQAVRILVIVLAAECSAFTTHA